jgi:hypothetical protein
MCIYVSLREPCLRGPGLHALKLKAKWPIIETLLVRRIPEFYTSAPRERYRGASRFFGVGTVLESEFSVSR